MQLSIIFLNNIKIKRLKTIYNNQKLFSRIQQFIVENIYSLNIILINLKTANITNIYKKSQFYCFRFEIISYIYDFKRQQISIFKILKIFNQFKYTNIITSQTFIKMYIYYQIQIKDFIQVTTFICNLFKKNSKFK